VGAHARPLGRVPSVCRARIDLVVNMQRLVGSLGWGWVALDLYVLEWPWAIVLCAWLGGRSRAQHEMAAPVRGRVV
jgi:hypothetical protein